MDYRDVAANRRKWYERIDENKMIAEVEISWEDDDEGEIVELVTVPIIFDVCEVCQGKGRYVNPAIDSHGITADEWSDWDDEEREGYISGRYDITCEECGGIRVVPVVDKQRCDPVLYKRVMDHIRREGEYAYVRTREMEMGY